MAIEHPKTSDTLRVIKLHNYSHYLAPRNQDSHKGDYGHVLIIGGDIGYGGAISLAAEAALRVGAGLVSVATQQEHVSAILARTPESMVKAISNQVELQAMLSRASVIVLGPGLGQSTWSKELLLEALKSDLPTVLDADGLNLVASLQLKGQPHWLMTPHPGEAARLLSSTVAEVEKDRIQAIEELHATFSCPVMLKGAGSLVFNTQINEVNICRQGNPGMASGGMGDVLSGVIGGLLAQNIPANDALSLGVCLHSTAADMASQSGERGMVASDLMTPLRKLVNA